MRILQYKRFLRRIFLALSLCCLTFCSVSAQIIEVSNIKKSLPFLRDSISYVDALNRMAMLSHLRFRDSCLIYATQARDLANRIAYQKGIADAINCQGIYYMSTNNYLSAKFFNDALKIYQTIGDRSNEAQVMMNISVLMFVTGSQTEAINYIYLAEKKSRALKNDSIRSIVLSDILTLDPRLNEKTRDSIYQAGLTVAKKYKDERMIISFRNNEGTMLYNQGRKKEGLSILLESLKNADSIGAEYVKVSAYMTIGEMMLDLGNKRQAVWYYLKGLESSQQYGYPERYLMLAQRLYEFYRNDNQPELAYKYASLLLAKQQVLSENLKKSGFGYLSYVLKENELAQLKRDEQIRKNVILFISCFAFLVLLILFFVYNSLRSKKKLLTMQKAMSQAAIQRNLELETEAKFKEMLIAVIAHDVRQPFSSIVMLASIFRQGTVVTDSDKEEIMTELQYLSSKSLAFMDGILDWIKFTQSTAILNLTRLKLKPLILEANSFFKSDQLRRNIKFILDIDEHLFVQGHEHMLLFVMRNLLNNATRFTSDDTEVYVFSTEASDFLTIGVRDTGCGMTSQELHDLFKPIQKKSENQGAGMAMNLSFDMMQKMRGRIWAESDGQTGSTFFISLPKIILPDAYNI